MITRRKLTESLAISNWLEGVVTSSPNGRYRHRLLKAKITLWPQIINDLRPIIQRAHEDAYRHLINLSEPLDPLEMAFINESSEDLEILEEPEILRLYPNGLHINDLKGYFGEIFAGIIAENYSPFNEPNWEVPVFLFRFHDVAMDCLEERLETGEESRPVPGRTGDDCVAFLRDDNGKILKSLFCEAKCSGDHSSNLLSKAHAQISGKTSKPHIRKFLEILKDYNDDNSRSWHEALRQLWLTPKDQLVSNSTYERCDLISYVCGRSPSPRVKSSWISPELPHSNYKAGRRLETAEIHLHGVEQIISHIYSNNHDLYQIWNEVLDKLDLNTTKALFSQQTALIGIDYLVADIGCSSGKIYDLAMEHLEEIESAFFQVTNENWEINFEVAVAPTANEEESVQEDS